MEEPGLHTVKPAKKPSLKGASIVGFESCIDESYEIKLIKTISPLKGVYVLDNVLSSTECSNLCDAIDGNSSLSFWSNGDKDKVEYRMFRNAETIEVNSTILIDKLSRRIQDTTDSLSLEVEDDDEDINYERELVGCWHANGLNNDILFAKYPSFGSFAPHTDGRTVTDFNKRSFYSVIIFLNSIPEADGGGTKFYKPEAVKHLKRIDLHGNSMWTADPEYVIGSVSAVAGRVLIFHQSMVHEGIPPSAPYEKYIIRSDVMFTRSPPLCDGVTDREAYAMFRQAEELAESGSVDESVTLFRRAFKLSPALAVIMGQA